MAACSDNKIGNDGALALGGGIAPNGHTVLMIFMIQRHNALADGPQSINDTHDSAA